MTGIYKLTNKLNNKIYIGQSCNIEKRIRQHFNNATQKNNKTPECYIDRAIKKYGVNNFEASVVEECPVESLNEREIFWINQFDSFNKDKGYNLTFGGNSGCKYNRKQIKELWDSGLPSKEIQLQANIINRNTLSQILIKEFNIDKSEIKQRADNLKRKRVQQFSLSGEYLQTYDSAKEAAIACDGTANHIQKVCTQWGKFKSAFGFLWKYEEDNRDISEWVARYDDCNNRPKPVYQYTKDLILLNIYPDAKTASEQTGANRNKIGEVCRGTRKSCGGFIWSYKELEAL